MGFHSTFRLPALALFLSWLPLQVASAKTYVVNPDGTGDFPNIQAAVDASVDDDEIELGNGVFIGEGNRNVFIENKRITIRSQSDVPTQCIIDCDWNRGVEARAFSNSSTDVSGPLIRGITIQDGIAGLGGAIFTNGSLRLTNCKFLENAAEVGGAVCVFEPGALGAGGPKLGARNVEVDDCDFIGNLASIEGGGAIAHLDETTGVLITNSRFMKNTTVQFGGAIYAIGFLQIDGTIFARNGASVGGAIVCGDSGFFTECTFALNSATTGSAIFYGIPFRGSGLILSVANTIIAFSKGGQPVSCEDNASMEFTCCDLYGNSAGDWVGCLEGLDKANGNFSANPLFCGLESADPDLFGDRFTLSPESPCLPSKGGCALIGARGLEECVPIPTKRSLEQKTWGQVKGLYRE